MSIGKSTIVGFAAATWALLVIAGSVAPWYRVGTLGGPYDTVRGPEAMGQSTLVAALIALLLVGMQLAGRRGASLVAAVALLVAALIGIAKWNDAAAYGSGVDERIGGVADASWGLLLVVLGGVMGAIFAAWQFTSHEERRRQQASSTPKGRGLRSVDV